MRLRHILLSILILSLTSCDKDDSKDPLNIEGQYEGTFERNGVSENVELNFTDGVFSGQSESPQFPAICSGSYSVSDGTIEFENECIWTADFDWTLILGQTWDYTYENDVLTLVKSNGDTYTLTQQ